MTKALFIDRDGIINEDKGYIGKPEDIVFCEGVFSLLKAASDKGFKLIVVTNQSGIARGMYTESDMHAVHSFIQKSMLENGVVITDFFHCPHHPEYSGECSCRKPHTGMLLSAAAKHGIDLHQSAIIGDKRSDVQTGRNAGLRTSILVKSRYAAENVPEADFFAENLHAAADYIKECF
jgi:D-glycero-D-manno-heptose 1,7-bisphosphate phosphatase